MRTAPQFFMIAPAPALALPITIYGISFESSKVQLSKYAIASLFCQEKKIILQLFINFMSYFAKFIARIFEAELICNAQRLK